ncbi:MULTISPECIES: hypothetical protein [Flammeovirga]|uniref:Tetratricopeptide repeat protein n=1 Tax=Flammeovirga agarivorans TaxID=2726742 RepID=A0A7X8SN92_9BACT|nr:MULTISPECIES: hypothetical protein [Flammeovirga]NLR93297.1 hypothetical protein [Flammeovirga agarivorans]
MKTLFSATLLSLFVLLSSFNTVSAEEAPAEEKMSLLIKMVNSADKNDWQTLNKAAMFCINWNADLELAKQWIEASIQISDNPEAYELMGDYYLRTGNLRKAYGYYLTSLEKGLFSLNREDLIRIQRKNVTFGRMLMD